MTKKGALRRVLLVIHLWLGLIIGLYFSALGATGSVLVFRTEGGGLASKVLYALLGLTPLALYVAGL